MKHSFIYSTFLISCVFALEIQSQTQIEILNADKISFNSAIDENRQLLKGNVKTKDNDRYLTCDSAYFYAKENKIEAFSNIHIWQGDSLNLKGENLIYYGNHQLAEIENNVHFTHHEMNLYSEKIKYNFKSQRCFFDQKAQITENMKSLSSDEGIYHTAFEKFNFYKNVIVEHKEEVLYADTLYYYLKSELAEFRSNAIIENNDMHITADKGWVNQKEGTGMLYGNTKMKDLKNDYTLHVDTCFIFDQLDLSVSYGNPLLSFPLNDDTLYVSADTLIHENKYNDRIFKAHPNAHFKSTEMLGSCDSMSFENKAQKIFLHKSPTIWLNEFQLTSDTITLVLEEKKLKNALLRKNSFITSKVDSTSFNQISGENMLGHFSKQELTNIDVMGNGESIYFVEDEKTKDIQGMNKIICSNMNITTKNKAIENIIFFEKPDAVLIPTDKIAEKNKFLKTFIWREKEKILDKIDVKLLLYKGF